MPTYDYKCSSCEYTFEKIMRISERHLPETESCPNCNLSNTVQQCIVAASLVSPFRLDGVKKAPSQFKERMQQIKHGLGKQRHNLKNHY